MGPETSIPAHTTDDSPEARLIITDNAEARQRACAMLCEASLCPEIPRAVGLPSAVNEVAAWTWLASQPGHSWEILTRDECAGCVLTRPVTDSVAPEYEGYWEISAFVLPRFRGLGLVYRTMPTIHEHLRALGVPGVHAFTWESDHSPTRLWRKMGYTLLGRDWVEQEGEAAWQCVWAYPLR